MKDQNSIVDNESKNDWRFEPERMLLREQCLSFLLKLYGSELSDDGSHKYSCQSMYECCHDWVSSGSKSIDGLLEYYQKYYMNK